MVLSTNPQMADQKALYDVLTEEGWLTRTVTSQNLGQNDVLIDQVIEYRLKKLNTTKPIVIGQVSLQSILSVEMTEPMQEETPQYQVQFSWQLTEPAPWLWAPQLEKSVRFRKLLEASGSPQSGSAAFIWSHEKWIIQSIDVHLSD